MAVSFNPFTGNLELGSAASDIDVQTISINNVEIIDSNRVLSNVTLSGVIVDAGEY